MSRVYACPVGDLPEGEALRLDTSPVIALFNVGGEFYAINDRSESWQEGQEKTAAYQQEVMK